jgi:preprotein translocase subunit SecD
MRRSIWFLSGTLVVVVGTFLLTVLSGNSPVLGLDLQGGIEVRLETVGRERPDSVLDTAVDIIRNRVDGLGVAETEVKRDGKQIVVDLPGVKDRNQARRLVGTTAELRFRPVLAGPYPCPTSTTTSSSSSTSSSTSTSSTSTGAPDASTSSSSGATGGPGRSVPRVDSGSTTSSTAAPETSTTTAAADPGTTTTSIAPTPSAPTLTPAAQDKRNATVTLCDREGAAMYQLGPTVMTGRVVDSAKAQFNSQEGGWAVNLSLDSGGAEKFNNLAAESFPKSPPQNSVAIVLDGVIQSAPAFQTPNFQGGEVSISGDFSQGDADDLATVLRFGSLPVQLKELTTTSISPTLGRDQLDAGILAGIIGLALVAVYMLVFYRLLGLVVIAGLALAAMAIYTLITFLGSSIGLTLTLAGVVGLIVSVGITVDSYVVYFEKLKDEVRTGRTVRSSVDRGFVQSFRTIVAADLVSLIAAAILYWRAVGSVRQFAFLLGVSTILDLVISYFFMHPLVQLLARRPGLVRARRVGIAAGLDTPEATA